MDEGGDDAARADTQRGQDLAEECSAERFDFLGYSFGPHRYKANGKWYLSASPSKKSVQRLEDEGRYSAGAQQQRSVARSARHAGHVSLGWSNYFCHGTCRLGISVLTDTSMNACATSSPDGTSSRARHTPVLL